MRLVVPKRVTIVRLIFEKKAMAYLPSWPTYPTLPYLVDQCFFMSQLLVRIDQDNLSLPKLQFLFVLIVNIVFDWYLQLPCLTLSIKGTVWRTSRQVYLLCRSKRHLAGFPHLGVVNRWPTTLKRVRIAL